MYKKGEIVQFFGEKVIIRATKKDPCLDCANPANVPLYPPKEGNVEYDYLISKIDKNSGECSGVFPCLESQLRPLDDVKGLSVIEFRN